MPVVPVNYLAILACGVSSMILGSLWYGPFFGKPWMKMMGFSPEMMEKMKKDPAAKKKMMNSYALMLVGALVSAYVLQHALVFAATYLKMEGVSAGLMAGFWNWLGFIAPATVGMVLWEGKPWKLWYIVSGYWLAQLLLNGVILALWK